MIYSYFEIGLKAAVVGCLTNALAPSANCVRELFKVLNGLASHLACTRKKLWLGIVDFFVSDIISEVVFGPFWLMLPGLGPNR